MLKTRTRSILVFCLCAGLAQAASNPQIRLKGTLDHVDIEDGLLYINTNEGAEPVALQGAKFAYMMPVQIKDITADEETHVRGHFSADDKTITVEQIQVFFPVRPFMKGNKREREAVGRLEQKNGALALHVSDTETYSVQLAQDAKLYRSLCDLPTLAEPGMAVQATGTRESRGYPLEPAWILFLPDAAQAEAIMNMARKSYTIRPRPKNKPDYLNMVKDYADAMIAMGRDTYAGVHSPLFACGIDRREMQALRVCPWYLQDIRKSDRMYSGANPMHDENLYQLLYALTDLTGDNKYGAEADKALKWFFENCQSGRGFYAWGEHQGWDFFTDAVKGREQPHEFYRPWVLMERSFDLAPKPMENLARALWEYQMHDRVKGTFSRHAMRAWETEGRTSDNGHEYPRHGGFYIATWAEAYARTKDPYFLRAVEVMVRTMDARRNPKTGALPAGTIWPDLMWPQSNLSLAIDLANAAKKVPAELAEKMNALAVAIDDTYLKLPHALDDPNKGFVKAAHATTLIPGDLREELYPNKRGRVFFPYTLLWAMGYGIDSHAQHAMICMERYEQTKSAGYLKLVLYAAELYLKNDPDPTDPRTMLSPQVIGEVMALELAAYEETKERRYLDRAHHFGQIAVWLFFDDVSPLPKAAANLPHYEAVTGGDLLMMEMLKLWAVEGSPETTILAKWTER